ncbi:MAG: DUF4199 domain-containing protein [Lewinellaceae bacterium]|nr:DUF4199 domain-containing protein [Phaeodactylibacter sp.]MCB9351069.1 DUF4199 domain-containing protein [Lewinellaceae bacterium]
MSTLDNPNDYIDPSKVSAWPTASRYGLLAGLVLVVLGLLVHLSGMVDYTDQGGGSNWVVNILNWGITIAAIVMAVKQHREEDLGGFISFGRSFRVGFLVTLVIMVISVVWGYIFFSFVEPGLIEDILTASREQMIEKQGMSEEQAEQGLKMMSWMFTPAMMSIMGGIFSLIAGVVFSLIVGAIMKREHPANAA